MTKYKKKDADFFIVPYLPEANFLNGDTLISGAILQFAQNDILPYALITEDLSLIMPEREDEATSGVGEGFNDSVVLESQKKVGAGSIPNKAISFLSIPRIGGNITVTHQVAEIWTVTAVVKESITASSYFNFDVIDSNHDHFQYQLWFDVAGGDAAPTAEDCFDPIDGLTDGVAKITTQGKRELIEADISGAADADAVAVIIKNLIDAKADVGAASVGAVVTVTNGELGAVMDAHDIDSGLTIATTTQGRDKIVNVFDPDTIENFGDYGFHFQRNNGALDTIYALTGISIAEHTLEVESGDGDAGVMKEDVAYMCAGIKDTYGALTMLAKPRSFYGVEWVKNLSPMGNKFKNHGWHTCNKNQTFTINSVAIAGAWFGWKVMIENDTSHDYDGGGIHASKVNFNARGCTITIDFQPEDYVLQKAMKQSWLDYGGADDALTGHEILIQLKSIVPGTGGAIFVQYDCDICKVIPFDETVNADGSPEQYSIELIPAPGATYSYTLQTYLPNYAFGLGGE